MTTAKCKTISASVAALAVGESVGRAYELPSPKQVNFRGRCAWGMPCDENRISYGCEVMTGNLGFCWSECAGYLPKVRVATVLFEELFDSVIRFTTNKYNPFRFLGR